MIELPAAFMIQMKGILQDEYPAFEESLSRDRSTSIRLNPHKVIVDGSLDIAGPVPWCQGGYYLSTRPKFNEEPDFYTGSYYVQEASSMFLSYILTQIELPQDPILFDACAAPGGKSLILQDHLQSQGTLIANEVIRSRAKILHENLSKWGHSNHIITNSDLSRFSALHGHVDLLLIDAPCSGEGLFRKDSQASAHWSLEHVNHCALRQKRILSDAVALLSEGAYLVYSTCTYNKTENEAQIDWLQSEYGMKLVEIAVPNEWQISKTEGGYRFYPHLLRGEGLFMSVLRKPHKRDMDKPSHFSKSSRQPISKSAYTIIQEYVNLTDPSAIDTYQDDLILYTGKVNKDTLKSVRIYSYGRKLGRIMHKGFRPAAQLAQSIHLSDQIEKIALSEEEVLKLMNHEDIPTENVKKGWYLLTYSQNSVHFAKSHRRKHKIQFPKY